MIESRGEIRSQTYRLTAAGRMFAEPLPAAQQPQGGGDRPGFLSKSMMVLPLPSLHNGTLCSHPWFDRRDPSETVIASVFAVGDELRLPLPAPLLLRE